MRNSNPQPRGRQRHGSPSAGGRPRHTSTSSMKRRSKRVEASTLGSHVRRAPVQERRNRDFAETIRRRAIRRRFFAGVIAIVAVIAVGITVGVFTFRSTVGNSMVLKDSNATDALVPPKAGDPYFVLIAADLGATALPLDSPGPDSLLLARVDNGANALALINIPYNLQISNNGRFVPLYSVAEQGDAALIEAIHNFTNVDIAHFVKINSEGLGSLVDKLDGLTIEIDQPIDDPKAGSTYLPEGAYELNGDTALVYLRAENLKMGVQDKLAHQLKFSAELLHKFLGQSGFAGKIDKVGGTFQTDLTLSDLEVIAGWLSKKTPADIIVATLPGYLTPSTGVNNNEERYVAEYEDFQELLKAIERGEQPKAQSIDKLATADPATISVDVQNGTTISGAAGITADRLRAQGFVVGEVGNAEQQVYTETLVIYKGDGLSKAKTVMEALGAGRPVDASVFYNFPSDILVIIGSDFSPVS